MTTETAEKDCCRTLRFEPGHALNCTRRTTCECERTDHSQFADGRCHRPGDGAEAMTGGKVVASPGLCMGCLFGCAEGDDDGGLPF